MSRLSLLVDLASLLCREVELAALLGAAGERVAEALGADRASIWLVDAERGDLVTHVALFPELPALRLPLGRGIAGYVAERGEPVRVSDAERDPRFDPTSDRETGYRTRTILATPVREAPSAPIRGVLQVLNKEGGAFDDEDERYLSALGAQLGRALSLTTLCPADASHPGLTLRGPFNHIVGRGAAMSPVYERVGRAAGTDASVLLRGATGTGKGLIARAIHVNSRRQTGPFVVVDCTTLPAQLVESELFGHERGAFTGADRRVPGKVELASGGTLLLDEIGDLPRESQGKLLRLLQDRAFERVGGRETLSADVRVLAATHRDLEAMVRSGTFREDLYYRLKVVELTLPSLEERGPEDIAALCHHFARKSAERHQRPELQLSEDTLARLLRRPWPGNVRELEHWIESATVLSIDGEPPLELLAPATLASGADLSVKAPDEIPPGLSLAEASRRYAARCLERCQGNRSEAARELQISRNTLARLLAGRSQ
ncbi:MAG: sigma-54-dependent Fis family transcriptional regulator [Polyangiaceae bacterium]|nr:sigma-54-dependent Fis family transcriptional regulator [Polyangiaceae bacterium]MCW5789216.1 sigma-54-dependent Fis family transcriptional regulator [Polyangiaceae bacterium]